MVQIDGKEYRVQLKRVAAGWNCLLNGRGFMIEEVLTGPNVLSLRIGGRVYEIRRDATATGINLWVGHTSYAAEWRDARSLRGRKGSAADDSSPKKLTAPMPGKVIRILLPEKSQVEPGQSILVMEAMKMQNEIKSPRKGIIQKIVAQEGANVNAGDVLAIVE